MGRDNLTSILMSIIPLKGVRGNTRNVRYLDSHQEIENVYYAKENRHVERHYHTELVGDDLGRSGRQTWFLQLLLCFGSTERNIEHFHWNS
jgi:hypothetical protein